MRACLWGTLVLVLLASCGGGEPAGTDIGAALTSAPVATARSNTQPIQPQRLSAQPQRAQLVLTDTALFDWAQGVYPQYFGGAFVEGNSAPYHYRYYFGQDTYLAVAN